VKVGELDLTLREWSERTGIAQAVLRNRLVLYRWPPERVVQTPVPPRKGITAEMIESVQRLAHLSREAIAEQLGISLPKVKRILRDHPRPA
jgi:hypothetical protein